MDSDTDPGSAPDIDCVRGVDDAPDAGGPGPLARPIVVAGVPSGHDYVRSAIGGAPGVVLRPDPVLDPRDPARWWPHPVLDPDGDPSLLDGVDIVHVHFGYEHRTPGQLAGFVAHLRRRGIALVVTVHDLTNPHLSDERAHLDRTGVLVSAADAVLTLTAGAARRIHDLWRVDALVVAHPPLIDGDLTRRWRRPGRRPGTTSDGGDTPVVGVFLGALRPGVACGGLVPHLAEATCGIDGSLRVMVREHVLAEARADGAHPRHDDVVVLDRLSADGLVELVPHPMVDDDRLCRMVTDCDVVVLPHRHGSHSGWIELCRDLAVPVVVPEVGFLWEQWCGPAADPVAEVGGALFDPRAPELPVEVGAALRRALDPGHPLPHRVPDAESAAIGERHAEVYSGVLSGPPPGVGRPVTG